MLTSRAAFLYKFILHPQQIGSITPSSSFLINKALSNIAWNEVETIIELGAGSGVFTEVIAKYKKDSCKVLLVEKDFEMRKILQESYPTFFHGSKAEKLDQLLKQHQLPQADCIISGLPFSNFPKSLRQDIMEAINNSLKPGGIYIGYQYTLQMRKLLKNHFREVNVQFVPMNLPPAFIFYCKK
ncbi:MAG: phospholipid N-methyltransferase [Firmicutes bacterium]|nr:phospholipid N-methyltransferase [Bacillota bacterium]